jgi:hypothetical protein
MALGALFLVVLSAFLHAAWNAAAKGSGAPAAFVFLADLTALVVLMPSPPAPSMASMPGA